MNRRISLRQMEYFVGAAKHGSILAASEEVHISSPSISAAIAHIEKELEVQLFIRQHAKGLQLTPVGEILKKKCQRILDETSDLYAWAAEISSEVKGKLKLGCYIGAAPTLYSEVIQHYSQTFEQVEIDLNLDTPRMLMMSVLSNKLDLALTFDLEIDEKQVNFQPLASLPPYALVSANHPLASEKSVTLKTLSKLPMVLLDIPYSYEYFLSLFEQQGLTPNIHTQSHYVEIVKTMVANELGYSIFNTRPRVNTAMDGKELVRIPIQGNLRPMKIGIMTPINAHNTLLVKSFIQHCQRCFADGNIPGMSAL